MRRSGSEQRNYRKGDNYGYVMSIYQRLKDG